MYMRIRLEESVVYESWGLNAYSCLIDSEGVDVGMLGALSRALHRNFLTHVGSMGDTWSMEGFMWNLRVMGLMKCQGHGSEELGLVLTKIPQKGFLGWG